MLAQLAVAMASSAPSAAMLLGSGRQLAEASAQGEGAARFAGVGRLECRETNERGVRHMATAWVAGSADTIVTAAHALFLRPAGIPAEGRTLDPTRCAFVIYDSKGQVREIARVRYAVSSWSDPRLRYDSSYDLAVLKLDRPVQVGAVPAVAVSYAIYTPSIRLAAFQSGIGDDDRLWLTAGEATRFPSALQIDSVNGTRITRTGRLFATSADSTQGSSGGMYYDPRQQAAIGLHVGSLCAQPHGRYDPESCFNYGLRFDARIVSMIASVAADRPLAEQLVRPSLDAAALQMAMLDARLP